MRNMTDIVYYSCKLHECLTRYTGCSINPLRSQFLSSYWQDQKSTLRACVYLRNLGRGQGWGHIW